MKTNRTLFAALLAVALLVLGACGSDDDEPAAAEGSSADGSGEERPIAHSLGETTIEGTPERVVTVGLTDQDPVMALGVAPVAAQAWYAEQVVYPWAEEALPDAEVEVIPSGELSPEQIRTYRPDLIIGVTAALTDTQYDQLSDIAPTIAAPEGTTADTVTWEQQTEIIGEALGLADEATALVEEADAAFAAVAEAHPDWAGKEAVLASQYIDGQLLVYPSDSPVADVLTRMGFTLSAGADELMDDSFGVPALSAERFDLIDVDLVLFDGYEEALAEAGLFDVPTYQDLAVVQEDRVVFPEGAVADALSFKNVLSLPWALEQLEQPITDALGS